jgi:hypothetical protein
MPASSGELELDDEHVLVDLELADDPVDGAATSSSRHRARSHVRRSLSASQRT